MTLEEVCKKYDVSESSMKTNFNRVQSSILKKKGINIIKEGRGNKVTYREEVISDGREETMFKALEPVKTGVVKRDLSLSNFTFCVFMGIITTPMLVFRGTHADFLKYIAVPATQENIDKLDKAIDELSNDCILGVMKDTTTKEEVLTLSLIRAAENDMKIGIDMIINCRLLASKHKKKDWIPLLKVWLGTELLSKQGSYTRQDLMNMTGLTKYMIDESTKILKESNIFITSRAYSSFLKCIGMKSDMNNECFYQIE